MCVKMLFTKKEMLKVSGVSENKFPKYGKRFAEYIVVFTYGTREKLYFGKMEEVLDGIKIVSWGRVMRY